MGNEADARATVDQNQNARLTKLETRMTAVETRVGKLESGLTSLTNRVSNAEQTIVALTSRAVALEDRVTQNEADIAALQGGGPVIPPPLPETLWLSPVTAEVAIGL